MSKFNEYARHQGRRRILILQAIDNKADSVKSLIPQGKENEKNHCTSSVNELAFCLLHNALIEKKLSFSFSEVQNLGTKLSLALMILEIFLFYREYFKNLILPIQRESEWIFSHSQSPSIGIFSMF